MAGLNKAWFWNSGVNFLLVIINILISALLYSPDCSHDFCRWKSYFSCVPCVAAVEVDPTQAFIIGVDRDSAARFGNDLKLVSIFGKRPIYFYRKNSAVIRRNDNGSYTCFQGDWYTRVLLTDVRPLEALEPYPLAATFVYLDIKEEYRDRFPVQMSLLPLNPHLFSPASLRESEKLVEGMKATIICRDADSPLMLLQGWPMTLTNFASKTWRRNVVLRHFEVQELPLDLSGHIYSQTPSGPEIFTNLTLEIVGKVEGVAEVPSRLVTLTSVIKNPHDECFMTPKQWISKMRDQFKPGSTCILQSTPVDSLMQAVQNADLDGSAEGDDMDEAVETEYGEDDRDRKEMHRASYSAWVKCHGLPAIIHSPPSMLVENYIVPKRKVLKKYLAPFSPWSKLAAFSSAAYIASSLLLWGRESDLSRLNVPRTHIPGGPLDIKGHLRFAKGLSSWNHNYANNVLNLRNNDIGDWALSDLDSRGAAGMGTPVQRGRVAMGSFASAVALSLGILTLAGWAGAGLKLGWNLIKTKAVALTKEMLHHLRRSKKGKRQVVDEVAERMLKRYKEDKGETQVLVMMSSPPDNLHFVSHEPDVVAWIKDRLASQVLLPPIDVYKSSESEIPIKVFNTRSNMTVNDFIFALMDPACQDFSIKNFVIPAFSLVLFFPNNMTDNAGFRDARGTNTGSALKEGKRVILNEHVMDDREKMRVVLEMVNAHRWSRLLIRIRPPTGSLPDSKSILKNLYNDEGDNIAHELLEDVTNKCFKFSGEKIDIQSSPISLKIALNVPRKSQPDSESEISQTQGKQNIELDIMGIPPTETIGSVRGQFFQSLEQNNLIQVYTHASEVNDGMNPTRAMDSNEQTSQRETNVCSKIALPKGLTIKSLGFYTITIKPENVPSLKRSPEFGYRVLMQPRAFKLQREGSSSSVRFIQELKRIQLNTTALNILNSERYDGLSFGFMYLPLRDWVFNGQDSEASEAVDNKINQFVHPLASSLKVLEGAVYHFKANSLVLNSSRNKIQFTWDYVIELLRRARHEHEN